MAFQTLCTASVHQPSDALFGSCLWGKLWLFKVVPALQLKTFIHIETAQKHVSLQKRPNITLRLNINRTVSSHTVRHLCQINLCFVLQPKTNYVAAFSVRVTWVLS